MGLPAGAPVLLWFRQDLRLIDNPALAAAVATGRPVIPVFVLDEHAAGRWAPGGAARWWLHVSLAALAGALVERGSRLVLRRGRAVDAIPRLVEETGAVAVHASRLYDPWARASDAAVAAALKRRGVAIHGANAALLFEPWTVRTQAGGPFGVYTPFSRACFAAGPPPRPLPAPAHIPRPEHLPPSEALDDWGLLPTSPDWAGGLRATWRPGEDGAQARLERFLAHGLEDYDTDRNRPDRDATSGLSPHLHWGEISPRQVWHAAEAAGAPRRRGTETFLKELLWREFSYHLLWHNPDMPEQPLKEAFRNFPWRNDPPALRAWQRGRTGYPIVDAGMRQLWHTGWMHNRVRMIVASFLIKHLLIPWQEGEAWFWDTLVDADLAANSASWQWVAGCGADAAPYFRIFNPVLQGRKFDPEGAYVRRWVPELAHLPAAHIHAPWEAPPVALHDAGVTLGRSYPHPIVDHAAARARALAALESIVQDRGIR
ncbi:deoxyribodipyrimidine photo-lyase [Elioraea sp.]|uniref:cryptochrome/photolyase family protein n=1 Tax=Elioraea sp. TaxID=2185103 RepID=UPI0021DEA758|nr:deoxyribodipyrimidine photo-lyase [Elioraea sp.]GIX08434.1 MAG: deoxyribodipyrimidine photo-lyase [Elioraea sp.]